MARPFTIFDRSFLARNHAEPPPLPNLRIKLKMLYSATSFTKTFYCHNVTWFHGTRANVILLTPVRQVLHPLHRFTQHSHCSTAIMCRSLIPRVHQPAAGQAVVCGPRSYSSFTRTITQSALRTAASKASSPHSAI